jgi:RNA polymerase sigma-70 factor (ECF subfamily)
MWSVVLRAAGTRSDLVGGQDFALEKLCKAYWPPLYHFLRRRGYTHDNASDLVQGFFESILSKNHLAKADQRLGRFRTFLIYSLNSYVSKQHERANAIKRGGGQALVSLSELDEEGRSVVQEPSDDRTPEAEFHEHWARTILTRALAKVRDEMGAELFDLLEPCLFKDSDAPALTIVSQRTGRATGTLKSDLFRLRGRLRDLIREEIRETVQTESDYFDELEQFKVLWAGR